MRDDPNKHQKNKIDERVQSVSTKSSFHSDAIASLDCTAKHLELISNKDVKNISCE